MTDNNNDKTIEDRQSAQMLEDIQALYNLTMLHMRTMRDNGLSDVSQIDMQLHHYVISFIGLMGGFSDFCMNNGEKLVKNTETIYPDLGGFIPDA